MGTLAERDTDDLVFDLDVLRGWKEVYDDGLRAEHALPALAVLVCRRPDRSVLYEFRIHGPETYVGRYHPQNGPVDVVFAGLEDHEVYRLSAPHIRLVMNERGAWTVRPMSGAAQTRVNGTPLMDARQATPIVHGDVLTLGTLEFEFKTTGVAYDAWLKAKKAILLGEDTTGLFLMRNGGICGPSILVPRGGRVVLGRSFPQREDLTQGAWRGHQQPDWNLAGLFEWERKFIGFLHAALVEVDEQWYIEPISLRQRTYVNRLEVTATTALMPGDEIALGSVLFHFHDPSDAHASTHGHTAEIPAVVNWREEHTNPRLEPIGRQTGGFAAIDRRTEPSDDGSNR